MIFLFFAPLKINLQKIYFLLIAFLGLTLAIQLSFPAFAQIRGGDSEEFFDEGDREMNQEIQDLEPPPAKKTPTLQQEEQSLEQELNIRESDPNAPKEEEVPSPSVGDGDNVSTPPPLGETEIKIPEP